MPTYATAADLADWLPPGVEVPAGVDGQLRRASRLVRAATLTAVYETNPATDIPTDPEVARAFREATCSQVETWLALDLNVAAGPAGAAEAAIAASSVGGGSVQYATSVTGDDARRAAVSVLSQEAVDILAEAGLIVGWIA